MTNINQNCGKFQQYFAIFGTTLFAESRFNATYKDNPSYSECKKAIENGVVVNIDKNGSHIFLYKDRLCTIITGPNFVKCLAAEIEK